MFLDVLSYRVGYGKCLCADFLREKYLQGWQKNKHDKKLCNNVYARNCSHWEIIPIANSYMRKQGGTAPSSKHLWSSNLSHWVMRTLQKKICISVNVLGNNNLSESGSITWHLTLDWFLSRICAQLQVLCCPHLHLHSQAFCTFPRLVMYL